MRHLAIILAALLLAACGSPRIDTATIIYREDVTIHEDGSYTVEQVPWFVVDDGEIKPVQLALPERQ